MKSYLPEKPTHPAKPTQAYIPYTPGRLPAQQTTKKSPSEAPCFRGAFFISPLCSPTVTASALRAKGEVTSFFGRRCCPRSLQAEKSHHTGNASSPRPLCTRPAGAPRFLEASATFVPCASGNLTPRFSEDLGARPWCGPWMSSRLPLRGLSASLRRSQRHRLTPFPCC